MVKIKFSLLLLILALMAACGQQKTAPTAGQVPDNEENRLAAARQYLEVAPPQDMLHELTAGVMERLPEPVKKTLMTVMAGKAMQDAASQIALKALVKHFNVNELKAMTAFYSTPEGKAIRQKQGAYMTEVMTGLNLELIKEFEAVSKEQAPKGAPPEQQKPGGPKAPAPGKMMPTPPQAPPVHPAPPVPPGAKPAPPSAK